MSLFCFQIYVRDTRTEILPVIFLFDQVINKIPPSRQPHKAVMTSLTTGQPPSPIAPKVTLLREGAARKSFQNQQKIHPKSVKIYKKSIKMRPWVVLGGRRAQGRLQNAPPGKYSRFLVAFWPKMVPQGPISVAYGNYPLRAGKLVYMRRHGCMR